MMRTRLNPITGRVNVYLENGFGSKSEDLTPAQARKQARKLLFLANESERIERSHEEPDAKEHGWLMNQLRQQRNHD